MAHYIPKIVYGALSTAFNFTYPPSGLPQPEQDEAVEHILTSISGARQVAVDFLEVTRRLKFNALTEAQIANLRTFFRTWAYLGKQFKFYDDAGGSSFETYELDKLVFKPKRTSAVGANAYLYELQLDMRRVEDEDVVDYTEAEILDNQAVAVDLTAVILNSTLYKSVKILYEVRRKTDSSELVENGHLTAIYKDSTGLWDITAEGTQDGDDAGVSFSMSGNQVQYTSTDMAGANYTGTMKIKEVTF